MIDPQWADLPRNLPIPVDDGAAQHLEGALLPSVVLPSTHASMVDLSMVGPAVVFFFPRTGRPGQADLVPEWDSIPGARGCTPQVCGFQEGLPEFEKRGYAVLGVSTQSTDYQAEMSRRLGVEYPILSDVALRLVHAMSLPVLSVKGHTLIKRMSWIVRDGRIHHVFYPVFPPDRSAAEVLKWIDAAP